MPDFLPRREVDLLQWSCNFVRQIEQDAQAFGIPQPLAEQYAATHAHCVTQYQLALRPDTRTPTQLQLKREAVEALRRQARLLAGIAQRSPGMTNDKRIALKLKQRRPRRRAVPRPVQPPVVWIRSVSGSSFHIELLDKLTMDRKGLPAEVKGAQVFTCAGDECPADLDLWRYHGQVSRARLTITFASELKPGTKVWVAARWVNPRLEPGPLSEAQCELIHYPTLMAG